MDGLGRLSIPGGELNSPVGAGGGEPSPVGKPPLSPLTPSAGVGTGILGTSTALHPPQEVEGSLPPVARVNSGASNSLYSTGTGTTTASELTYHETDTSEYDEDKVRSISIRSTAGESDGTPFELHQFISAKRQPPSPASVSTPPSKAGTVAARMAKARTAPSALAVDERERKERLEKSASAPSSSPGKAGGDGDGDGGGAEPERQEKQQEHEHAGDDGDDEEEEEFYDDDDEAPPRTAAAATAAAATAAATAPPKAAATERAAQPALLKLKSQTLERLTSVEAGDLETESEDNRTSDEEQERYLQQGGKTDDEDDEDDDEGADTVVRSVSRIDEKKGSLAPAAAAAAAASSPSSAARRDEDDEDTDFDSRNFRSMSVMDSSYSNMSSSMARRLILRRINRWGQVVEEELSVVSGGDSSGSVSASTGSPAGPASPRTASSTASESFSSTNGASLSGKHANGGESSTNGSFSPRSHQLATGGRVVLSARASSGGRANGAAAGLSADSPAANGVGGGGGSSSGGRLTVTVADVGGVILDNETGEEVVVVRAPKTLTKQERELMRRDAERETKWLRMVQQWGTFQKRHPKTLKRRIRKGVPDSMRGLVWPALTGAKVEQSRREKNLYARLLTQTGGYEDTIGRDINRTFPQHVMFRADDDADAVAAAEEEKSGRKLKLGDKISESRGQATLFNVCKAYSVYDPEVGYCQGIGFLAGIFLMYSCEEDAFWNLQRLLRGERYFLHGLFSPGFPLLMQFNWQLDRLLHKFLPRIGKHFAELGVVPDIYATQWFMTVFSHSFPPELVLRIWDIFLSEGVKIVFRVILFLFKRKRDELLELDFPGVMTLLKSLHHDPFLLDADRVIDGALRVPLTSGYLHKLAKKYQVKKAKEDRAAKDQRQKPVQTV